MSGMEDPIQPIVPSKMNTFVLCQTVFLFMKNLGIPNVENLRPEVCHHSSGQGGWSIRVLQALKKQAEVEMMDLNKG